MKQSEALEKISEALGVLTHQTRAENLAGFLSKNKLVENLLLPVFQIVLNAPKLLNFNQTNFPYIDMADDRSRLAIQVTTETTAEKVTETLRQFISHNYHKRYKRLVFFILTASKPKFTVKSKKKWKRICRRKLRFNPQADIITTPDLFPLIAHLSHSKILSVHDIIAQSVIGQAHIDVDGLLSALSLRQIEYEKKTGKYIPDIFVETRETKSLARSFAHPVLFFQRTLDSLGRLDILGSDRFLHKAGLPPLPFPKISNYASGHSLSDVSTFTAELSQELSATTSVLKKYHDFSYSDPPPFEIREDGRAFYEENRWNLQGGLGLGLNSQIEDLLEELAATRSQVFILTGRAGQGKTNLVCDFVENFLLKYKVPCAYLSVRRLRSIQGPELGDAIQRLLFEGKTGSFAEAAELLSTHASRVNKPFVLIVDGLNEHHRISEFAEQLGNFITDVVRYPGVKVFLTCRSEYFRQRFGNLLKVPLSEHVFVQEANENRLEDEAYDEMVVGYFKFFEVLRELVSDQVVETLKKDILLLRFFCEAYGARGKPSEYRQEFITNVYREQIFEIYLDRKLGMAKAFLQRLVDKPSPTDEKADLSAVLEHCLGHMLNTWQFADVPMSVIPTALNTALYALLDEELILRRDATSGPSTFSPSTETINFTFDEFRDFLLAQYLVYKIYATDKQSFERYIAKNDPRNSQIVEGLKKFLFYVSRKEGNADFWKFYKEHAWYKDVYDREIFNVDTKLLRGEDREHVVAALNIGDERAIDFAIQLALNWHPIYRRLLNLDLLISFVAHSDNTKFDALILKPFTTVRNHNEGRSAKGFCKFVKEHILPEFAPGPDRAENGLFRFLILLLPVDSGYDLNSESYFVFLTVLQKFPEYAVNLLVESLCWSPTRHRPYVWRLLSSESAPLTLVEPLREQAEKEYSLAKDTDEVLSREAKRFLSRLSTFVEPSA